MSPGDSRANFISQTDPHVDISNIQTDSSRLESQSWPSDQHAHVTNNHGDSAHPIKTNRDPKEHRMKLFSGPHHRHPESPPPADKISFTQDRSLPHTPTPLGTTLTRPTTQSDNVLEVAFQQELRRTAQANFVESVIPRSSDKKHTSLLIGNRPPTSSQAQCSFTPAQNSDEVPSQQPDAAVPTQSATASLSVIESIEPCNGSPQVSHVKAPPRNAYRIRKMASSSPVRQVKWRGVFGAGDRLT